MPGRYFWPIRARRSLVSRRSATLRGLLGASLLGPGVAPMTSAYTTCEAFGWPATAAFIALSLVLVATAVLGGG